MHVCIKSGCIRDVKALGTLGKNMNNHLIWLDISLSRSVLVATAQFQRFIIVHDI